MEAWISICFELVSDVAKVGVCEKFIKGQKVIVLTRVTGDLLSSSWQNSGIH